MIIGLTGTLGAGKDAVAKIFMKHGFVYHSLSDLIRDQMKREGVDITLENETDFGNQLRARDGANILARVMMERIEVSPEDHSLVVSIRNPAEVKELRKRKDFLMVAVDAPIESRYERIQERHREDDMVTFDKFKEIEERQEEGDDTQQQLLKVIEMADYKIINDGTLRELDEKVEDLIDYIKKSKKKDIEKESKEN